MNRPQAPFYLIRHGETDWNVERRFQGQTDIAMNANGRAQAAANGKTLLDLQSDWTNWQFIASPLGRTRETMSIIRAQLGLRHDDFITDERLLELTFGDWEGNTITELEQIVPDQVAQRYRDKWGYRQPRGESYEDGLARVEPLLAGLDQPSVIVSHGGIIRIIRQVVEQLDLQDAAEQTTPQDQVYYFDGTSGRYL